MRRLLTSLIVVMLAGCGSPVEPPPPCTLARAVHADTAYHPNGRIAAIVFTCDRRLRPTFAEDTPNG